MVPVPFWRRPPSPFVMWYLCHKPTTSVKFLSKSLFHSISLLSIPLMTRGCPHCHSFYEARTSHTTGLAALFFLKNVWLIFGSSWSESVCQFPNETTKAKPAGILTGITWKPEFKLRRTNIFTRSHSPGLVSTWGKDNSHPLPGGMPIGTITGKLSAVCWSWPYAAPATQPFHSRYEPNSKRTSTHPGRCAQTSPAASCRTAQDRNLRKLKVGHQ